MLLNDDVKNNQCNSSGCFVCLNLKAEKEIVNEDKKKKKIRLEELIFEKGLDKKARYEELTDKYGKNPFDQKKTKKKSFYKHKIDQF